MLGSLFGELVKQLRDRCRPRKVLRSHERERHSIPLTVETLEDRSMLYGARTFPSTVVSFNFVGLGEAVLAAQPKLDY